jgi:hypothetical protein
LGEHGIEYIDISAPTQARLEHSTETGSTKPAQQSAPPTQSTVDVPLAEEMADEVKF